MIFLRKLNLFKMKKIENIGELKKHIGKFISVRKNKRIYTAYKVMNVTSTNNKSNNMPV